MGGAWGKYVLAALAAAALTHLALVHAAPRFMMGAAIERLSKESGFNAWRLADRVTAQSRQIVRPSPDFAYSACVYDLGQGPVLISAAPWDLYWSLSLYAENTDNYFVMDDREARHGAQITLVRAGRAHPEDADMVVESPSQRGIALIRRLAPSPDSYSAAAQAARGDVCASTSQLTG
jgi:uncharacterized membrane protein